MDFMDELQALEREKGVPAEAILDALANALVSAYKRTPGAAEEARVTIDPDTGEITVYGQELDEDGNVTREWVDTPEDFGRIAAQTAKQVIVQRLRDAKRAQVYDTYEGREGDLVTGIVQQSDHRSVILDLGNADAVMPSGERIPYERLERGARVKALILEVRGEAKGPQIVVSRSHPDFIRRLFELEVPETGRRGHRDPGHRPRRRPPHQDRRALQRRQRRSGGGLRRGARLPGAPGGQRVARREGRHRGVARRHSPVHRRGAEPGQGAPGHPRRRDAGPATVVVPDHQLSLAIGKEGQNARLAARLSGYRVDIRSETEQAGGPASEAPAAETTAPEAAPGVGAGGPDRGR